MTLHQEPTVTLNPDAAAWLWMDVRTAHARAKRAGWTIPDEILAVFDEVRVLAGMSESGPDPATRGPAKSPTADAPLASSHDRHDDLGADELCPEDAAEAIGLTARHLRRLAANGALEFRRVGKRGYAFTPEALRAYEKRSR